MINVLRGWIHTAAGCWLLALVYLSAFACSSMGTTSSVKWAWANEPPPVSGGQETPEAVAPSEEEETGNVSEGPCLPLHTIEGSSGHFSVMSAYLANPALGEGVLGKPSLGYTHVHLGNGKNLEAFTLTETLWDRIELGYGLDLLDVGDSFSSMGLGARAGHYSKLHNFNARAVVVKDGDFNQSWMPAVTAGVHFKYNESLGDVNEALGVPRMNAGVKGLKAVAGIRRDYGLDVSLFASKMFTFLSKPLIATAGLRLTDSAHLGLLGFTGHQKVVMEGAICFLATDRLVLAAEYRQKPDEYREVKGLINDEDDWWVLAAGYLVSDQVSLAVGYGHFGQLLNHTANKSWGVAIKFEF